MHRQFKFLKSVIVFCLLSFCLVDATRTSSCINQQPFYDVFASLCWPSEQIERDGQGKSWSSDKNTSATEPFLEALRLPPYPWTHDPFCIPGKTPEATFCVWSDSKFARGRGISIIATPTSARLVAQHAAFKNSLYIEEANKEVVMKYEIRPLPGRGLGLVAKEPLLRGARIFSHTPVIAAQLTTETLPDDDLYLLHQIAVKQLPYRTRDKFVSLHGHFGGDPTYDRFQTNGFRILDYAGVFPETSVRLSTSLADRTAKPGCSASTTTADQMRISILTSAHLHTT